MSFGAALIPTTYAENHRKALRDFASKIGGKPLHCSDLGHFEVAAFAREVAQLKVLLFGVISKKSTLGDYREKIEGETQAEDYYNKCTHYLLERVGHWMSENDIGSNCLSVVFEEKRHNYQRLRSYIQRVRSSPIDRRAAYLAHIDPLSITAQGKSDEDLLAIADLVAFSLHQSVNTSKSNLGIGEQRYIRELERKFWRCSESGKVANFGMKYIKGPVTMGLSGSELAFAMKMYSERNPQDD